MRMWFVAVLLLMPDLGGPFIGASAEATRVGDELRVELEVQLNVLVGTVVAHIIVPGDEQQTVALADRGNGVYGGLVTIPAEDVVVLFEALDVDRDIVSLPVTLSELGVDPAVFQSDRVFALPEEESRGVTSSARRWLWAAAALGAASLSLIAWWAAGSRDENNKTEPEPSDGQAGSEEPSSAEDSE